MTDNPDEAYETLLGETQPPSVSMNPLQIFVDITELLRQWDDNEERVISFLYKLRDMFEEAPDAPPGRKSAP